MTSRIRRGGRATAAEAWFVDHGLPCFVDDIRDEVAAG